MTTKKKAPQVRIHTVLKKRLPLLAAQLKDIDKRSDWTLDKAAAAELSKLISDVPDATLQTMNFALTNAIKEVRALCLGLLATLEQGNIAQDLRPLAEFALQEFQRRGFLMDLARPKARKAKRVVH